MKRKTQIIKCGDIIQIQKSNLYSDDMKFYSMHDQYLVNDLSECNKFAIILDDQPKQEINKSGKLKIFVDNQVIYLHHSDFIKV